MAACCIFFGRSGLGRLLEGGRIIIPISPLLMLTNFVHEYGGSEIFDVRPGRGLHVGMKELQGNGGNVEVILACIQGNGDSCC